MDDDPDGFARSCSPFQMSASFLVGKYLVPRLPCRSRTVAHQAILPDL